MSLPDPGRPLTEAELARSEAAQLFVDRATSALSSFSATAANAPAIAQVCRQLDGIPLAIELAAARVKGLSVEEIASRLTDRFRLLIGGSRTALPRHQTLRATMDWSYGLLSEQERVVWRRLAVFSGGFTLEAAEGICGGRGVDPAEILNLLARLVDRSLVVVDVQAGMTRYRLLETVRQYGWERLVEAAELAEIQRRHRDWYLAMAERADPETRGPQQKTWIERLEMEHDNLRAALEWNKSDPRETGAEVRLAGALTWFWFVHGHWSEARKWLEGALERATDVSPTLLPYALQGAALFAWRQNDVDRATLFAQKGLELCQQIGDTKNRIRLVVWLSVATLLRSDVERAAALLVEGATLARTEGDPWLLALVSSQQGVLERDLRNYGRAIALHAEALAAFRSTGDTFGTAYSLRNLAMDTSRSGNNGQSAAYYAESLRLCREIGDRWVTEECLAGLAAVAGARGEHERAARLFGAVEAMCELIGHIRGPVDQAYYDSRFTVTRGAMGETAFAAAWAAGRAMSVEDVVAYALAGAAGAPVPGKARARALEARTSLAPREREVAALIARGLSNRQIAAELTISERTAETHVQHILNKLSFDSRAQIAAWAAQRGLLQTDPEAHGA